MAEKTHYDWALENIKKQVKAVIDPLKAKGYTIVGFDDDYQPISLHLVYHYGEANSKWGHGCVNICIHNCIAIRTDENGSINAYVENYDGSGKRFLKNKPIPKENWYLLYSKDTLAWFNKGKQDFSLESYERWENTKYLITHVNEFFDNKKEPEEKPITQKEVEEGLREMGVLEDDDDE